MDQVGPITSSMITNLLSEYNNEETQETMKQNIINPLIDHVVVRLQPYVIAIICTFIILFILIVSILTLIIKANSSDIKYKMTV